MSDLSDRLVICSLENCLGPGKDWLPSDKTAAKLYAMMGGKLVLETKNGPEYAKKHWEELGLDTPVLCWQGNWLYSYTFGGICGGNALPKKEMRALVRDILEAFPAVGLSILCQNGEQYVPRMNRLAHAYLKDEKAVWVLGELDAAPVPWYKVTLFAEPALFRKIRMYLAEKEFQDYRLEQDALRMQIYPKALGKQYTVEKLWELMRIKPENTYWLGGRGLPRELLEKMGAAAPGQMPAERVIRASTEGCLGELLYALSKG